MIKKKNKPDHQKEPSAERILQWLEEAYQFVKAFLSPKEIKKWRTLKNPHY
jgi:hypothetical protein